MSDLKERLRILVNLAHEDQVDAPTFRDALAEIERKNESGNVSSACAVDCVPEGEVVRRVLDEVVEQGASVADQRRRATWCHQRAR